jgi:hypothetical protein
LAGGEWTAEHWVDQLVVLMALERAVTTAVSWAALLGPWKVWRRAEYLELLKAVPSAGD